MLLVQSRTDNVLNPFGGSLNHGRDGIGKTKRWLLPDGDKPVETQIRPRGKSSQGCLDVV